VTTSRQIKELAAPLLARHDDLALAGRMIVLKPVHHLLRFVFINRTGDSDVYSPKWSATDLFHKLDDVPLGLGDSMLRDRREKHIPWWLWSDPTAPKEFVEIVERVALPKLRAIQTLQDYLKFALPTSPVTLKYFWGMQISFSIAMGDLDAARDVFKSNPDAAKYRGLDKYKPGLTIRLLERGRDLGADDRAELARLLHEWEGHTVGKLKLDKLWERTPFPIELQAAA
jgi:hypothetical protein